VDNAELLAVIRQTLGGPVQLEKPEFLPEPKRRTVLLWRTAISATPCSSDVLESLVKKYE
jgi:hypothetical protein